MLAEWDATGEKKIPWVIGLDSSDFAAYVQVLIDESNGIVQKENFVPSSTFWLVDSSNTILGVSNLRHYLNDRLQKIGGHIGYGITPSHRRKGYATKILELSLVECRKRGIEKALVTCEPHNIGSRKTILSNGGVHTQTNDIEGMTVEGYWIDVK